MEFPAFKDKIRKAAGESSKEFSLEAVVRSAARRMLRGALESEVTEFLQWLPGEKVFVSSEQERTRAASDVGETQFCDVGRRDAFYRNSLRKQRANSLHTHARLASR